jgi:hypothetical protein
MRDDLLPLLPLVSVILLLANVKGVCPPLFVDNNDRFALLPLVTWARSHKEKLIRDEEENIVCVE